MRAGLSTIQQTLTADSASVLNRSISEAARRSHSQTTPLHVAATLLAAPTGLLRQACIRSHPASSHPLQCRALELCFTVALDRLPSSANSAKVTDPPISNALMAALKRAQAHQRRGCPEQQQQPLLAVKVELEQLIISVLDDPSVSRVMREASFSSPAVKATIEQSLSPSPSNSSAAASPPATPPATQNLYLNPRLHHQQPTTAAAAEQTRKDEPQRVLDIMTHTKKRNPVVVSDSDPASIIREVLKRIAAGDAPPPVRAANVIAADVADADRSTILTKIRDFGRLVEAKIGDGSGRGVILDLGDLKWLVEAPGVAGSNPIQQQQHQQQLVSETGRSAVAEIARIVQRFADSGRLWVVATASCATYLRCQVYHPAMDADWDLQALPVAPRTPFPVLFPRNGGNGILSSSVESLAPARGFPALGTTGVLRRPVDGTEAAKKLCALCIGGYEKELARLVMKKFENSSAVSRSQSRPELPHWMKTVNNNLDDQIQSKPQEHAWKQSTEELLKNWREKCSQLHPALHPSGTFAPRKPLQPRLILSQGTDNATNATTQPFKFLSMAEHRPRSPPGSPVQTELVLGPDKAHRDKVKNYTTYKLNELSSDRQGDSFDSFKRLYKGLADRVGWQPAAATAVATAVTQCKSGKPRGTAWLMFVGPDKVGKKKMATALSDLVFGAAPVTISLVADDSESAGARGRGMTSVDRISDAVRRNPFSVVVLEGFDMADLLVRGTIRRAIESGRLLDSQGREVSLESAIFVLNTNWLPEELKNTHDSNLKCEEERILSSANCGWQLEFSVSDRIGKRGAECTSSNARPAKLRKESCGGGGGGLSLDLNLAAGMDEDTGEGSLGSSELTVEDAQVSVRLGLNSECATNSPAAELIKLVDGAIEFKPVDFSPIRRKVLESIYAVFGRVIGNGKVVRVDEDALDIMVGAVWHAGAGVDYPGFDEWTDKVLVPSLQQLHTSDVITRDGLAIVRLSAVKDLRRPQLVGGLPSRVSIAGVGA